MGSFGLGLYLFVVQWLPCVFTGNQPRPQLRSQPQGEKLMKRPHFQVNLSYPPPGAAPGLSSGLQW